MSETLKDFLITASTTPVRNKEMLGTTIMALADSMAMVSQLIKEMPFLKLVFYFSLQQWEEAERKFLESFFNMIRAMGFR